MTTMVLAALRRNPRTLETLEMGELHRAAAKTRKNLLSHRRRAHVLSPSGGRDITPGSVLRPLRHKCRRRDGRDTIM